MGDGEIIFDFVRTIWWFWVIEGISWKLWLIVSVCVCGCGCHGVGCIITSYLEVCVCVWGLQCQHSADAVTAGNELLAVAHTQPGHPSSVSYLLDLVFSSPLANTSRYAADLIQKSKNETIVRESLWGEGEEGVAGRVVTFFREEE